MARPWGDPRPHGVVDRPAAVEELSDRMETLRRETARKVMRRFMADTTEMARQRDRYRAALTVIVDLLSAGIAWQDTAAVQRARDAAVAALAGDTDG